METWITNSDPYGQMLKGKKILITGGTGTLGKAVLTRARRNFWGAEFVIFSRDETKQSILRQKFPEHQYVLGDITRYNDLKRAMRGIDIVMHFAAYKQVPSAQNNIAATIETNIYGSQQVVEAAIDMEVSQVVTTSTDKAASPESAYGVGKKMVEYVFQDANKYGATNFHITRYGNVLASNQSVAVLWEHQAKVGGPITITDRRMTRFFLSIDEAINQVLMSLQSEPGVILVPKAPSILMIDFAKEFAQDLAIVDIGLRPGEKIHEGMVSEAESFYTEDRGNFYLIHPPTSSFRNEGAPFSYTSDKPSRFLSAKELLEMLDTTHALYGV